MRRGVAVLVPCVAALVSLAGCSAINGSGSATASPVVITAPASPTASSAASLTASPSVTAGARPTGSATASVTASPSAAASPSVSPSVSPRSPSPSASPTGNPKTLLAQGKAAFLKAGTVHLTGTLTGNGKPAPLDIRISGDTGGTGFVTFPQGRITVLRIGPKIWTSAAPATWTALTKNAATGAGLGGKYVTVAARQNVADFTKLTKASALAADLLTPSGTLTLGPPATIRGVPAIALRDGTNGGILYLAAAAPHLPLAVDAPGTKLQLSDYGTPVALTAPPAAKVTSLNGF